MIDMGVLGETQTRRDLANLLHTAVELSGRNRCEIAREADLHKDALRRTLIGERSPSVGEALRILASSGMASHAHMLLFLGAGDPLASDRHRQVLRGTHLRIARRSRARFGQPGARREASLGQGNRAPGGPAPR